MDSIEYEGRRVASMADGEREAELMDCSDQQGRRERVVTDDDHTTHDVVTNATNLAGDISLYVTYSNQTIENLTAVSAQLRSELDAAIAENEALKARVGEMLSGIANSNQRIRGYDSFAEDLKTLLAEYCQELGILELAN